ncbi:hypothetical protein P0136_00710 [Lentisphaerota bacterium ZTH]|nr:hypothetical protein JYG24_08145 [Lentisphaerota bacterium]WET06536.1 hypothetical protein P0136_00710 [Lentisphaerota bacterium ZTH]
MQLAKREFIKLIAVAVFLPQLVKFIPDRPRNFTKAKPCKRAPGREKTVNLKRIQKRGDWLG